MRPQLFRCITFLMLFWLALPARAQLITEGKVLYDITYKNLSSEAMRHEHLLPHDASLYFKNSKTRLEMGMGSMGKNTTIHDSDRHQSIILLYVKGKRFALIKSDSEMAVVKKEMSGDTIPKTVNVKIENEFKLIAGKNCQKAIVSVTRNGKTQDNECWFTKEIPPYNTQDDENLNAIGGFLMQYSITENGMTMQMTVKLVSNVPIDDKMFEIPAGYQVVTEEELNRVLMVMQGDSGY